MTLRRLRTWLYVTTVLMLTASAGIMLWASVAPCEGRAGIALRPAGRGDRKADRRAEESPPLEAFQPLFERKFQRPLYDPPPPEEPEPEVKKKPSPPPVTLVATMIEATGNQAMFSDNRGNILIRGVGDQLEGGDAPAEIVEIDQDRVVLKCEEEVITLTMN